MFGLVEASTSRRAVAVGRPIAASSGSILASESFVLTAGLDDAYLKRYSQGVRWAVHSLNTSRGTTLEEFIDGLSDDDAAAEAEALLEMLEAYGNQLRRPTTAALGDGLFEARGPTTGVRLFFVYAPGHRIIVLDGYVKKRKKIPASIMTRIRKLQKDAEKEFKRLE